VERPTVYALVNGPLGAELDRWLRGRTDVELLAVRSDEAAMADVREAEPDLLLCAGYNYLLPEAVLETPPLGAVNLHRSYLPYARRDMPSVWSIVDDHPAGVSIHYMVEEIDAGPLIARREVPVFPDDDGQDLLERQIDAHVDLLEAHWSEILAGDAATEENPIDEGTLHTREEFESLRELDMAAETTTEALLDRLRALSSPAHRNAYFTVDGETYHVEVDITHESGIDH